MDTLDKFEIFSKDVKRNTKVRFSHTWNSENQYCHRLIAYVLQCFLKKFNSTPFGVLKRGEFSYDFGKSEEVITEGLLAICFHDRPLFYELKNDYGEYRHTIQGDSDVSELVKLIDHELKWNNPLHGKYLEISQGKDGMVAEIPLQPTQTFDDLILEESFKEQVSDDTVFQLHVAKQSNGILLYGDPGYGKTLTETCIAGEAIRLGYSAVSIESPVNFDELNLFMKKYIPQGVLILDEIGKFAEDRNRGTPGRYVDPGFLRFLSGVTNREHPLITVASTNDIGIVDDALKRAGRFSCKYEFVKPTTELCEKMIRTRFIEADLSEHQIKIASKKGFSGAEIAELERRARTISLKRNVALNEIFDEAVYIVSGEYFKVVRPVGFGSK